MAFDRLILFIHLFFHRFAVETGGSGACEIKVSLLDGSQTEPSFLKINLLQCVERLQMRKVPGSF